MKPVIGLFGAAALLSAASVAAQDASETKSESSPGGLPRGFLTTDYLGILGTYTSADKDRGMGATRIKRAGGADVFYGHQFEDSHFGYELHGFADLFGSRDAVLGDFYRYALGGDLVYAFRNRAQFTPFLLLGGGASYNDVAPGLRHGDGFSGFADAGAGFVTAPFTSVGLLRLRGEARYIHDGFADGYGDVRVGLGIEIPLLKDVVLKAAPDLVQIVEVDTGLIDSDDDGVVDSKDKCPGTRPGVRVDGDGCPLPKVMLLKGVSFETNQARLRPDAETILDAAAAILKKYPDLKVEVAGHTDNKGAAAYNQQLSQRRAAAVRDYFVGHGVPEAQMTAKGYGATRPVASNGSKAGRERNRRVELRTLD